MAEKTSTQPVDTANYHDREPRRTAKGWKRALPAGILVAAMTIVSIWLLRGHGSLRSNAITAPAAVVLLPLTTIEGDQRMPAISPDGSRVVFWRSASLRNESGLYAAVVGSQSSVRLTQSDEKTPAAEDPYSPTWSPDGREVAFLRDRGDRFLIETVPALGGSEKTIYTGVRSPGKYETGAGGLKGIRPCLIPSVQFETGQAIRLIQFLIRHKAHPRHHYGLSTVQVPPDCPRLSSRRSQLFANFQSRCTVSGETFKMSAISFTLSPPKKRNSTT